MSAEEALAPTRRHQHILPDGRVAYEWSQSLSDVTVFVPCPQGVRGRDLDVCIERERCRLGLKGNPPYLDVSAAFSSRMERKETALYPALVSGKDQRGGTEERRRAGGAKRFFCFFFLFCFFFDDARSKKSTTAKSLTPFQPAFFTSTPHQNRSTRPSASSRLQSRSGRSVRRPDRLDEERVTSPLFFSSTPKPKHHLVRFENPPTSPLSSFSLTSLASLVPPPPPTHPPHKKNL